MRSVALVLTLGACGGEGGVGPDASGGADAPVAAGECLAALGDNCDGANPCDLGLRCDSETAVCVCDAPPCTVACYDNRALGQLMPAGDGVLISTHTELDWRIEREPGTADGVDTIDQGAGAIVMATAGDGLYTVVEDGGGPPNVQRRGFDGAGVEDVGAGFSQLTSLAVAEPLFVQGFSGRVWFSDREGGTGVLGPDEYFPQEIQVVDGRAFWINRGLGVADDVRSNDLTGTSLQPVFVSADDLTGLTACGTTLYVGGYGAGAQGLWRWTAGDSNPTQVTMTPSYGAACAGGQLFVSIRQNVNNSNTWAVGLDRIGADDSVTAFVRLAVAADRPLQVARDVVATPAFVYWKQVDDQPEANAVERVMRMPR